MADWLTIDPEVDEALQTGAPVVALESTVITHGLPKPENLSLARRMESVVRSNGAMPATVAVLHGQVRLGLASHELEQLAGMDMPRKLSLRDLGAAVAQAASGGTTVAATSYIAAAAGVRLFATGGIGGVHRGPGGDVSADLPQLARSPIAVVCAGAKAILDLPRTVEWLETAAVPVVGWQCAEFPAFYSRQSGLPVSARVDDAQAATELLLAHWALGLESAVLIGVPCPQEAALPVEFIEQALAEAEHDARRQHIQGARLTPFLLARLADITQGATLKANLALLLENARVAALIAVQFARMPAKSIRRTRDSDPLHKAASEL